MPEFSTPDELDWSIFDDARRQSFVASIDERAAAISPSFERITRLAAAVTGAGFAQISLIGSSQFVPAAYGCSYEKEQQHSPPRDSLCAVTMAHGNTLRIDDAQNHPWVQHLPPVESGAIGCYLGVPLWDVEGRPIGALCVFDTGVRSWGAGLAERLEDLAALVTRELHLLASLETRAASEIRLRQVVSEIVARPSLSRFSHLVAAARYLTPDEAPAGGDWVDFFEIDHSRVMFSVGDVVGHGLSAVIVMDEVRHALRAYAFDSVDPSDSLHRADRLLSNVRPESMATALQGEYDAATHTVRMASAGHPPPVLIREGVGALIDLARSPPLGCHGTAPAIIRTFSFIPGDRLVLATDGVFERRTESLDAGLARLVAITQSIGTDVTPGATADAVLAEIIEGDLRDDASILIIDNHGGTGPQHR